MCFKEGEEKQIIVVIFRWHFCPD